MLNRRFFVVILNCILSLSLFANSFDSPQSYLYSQSASEAIADLASGTACESTYSCNEASRAVVLLESACEIDPQKNNVLGEILDFAFLNPQEDYSQLIYAQLKANVEKTNDITPLLRGTAYLLSNLDSREEKQQLLEKLAKKSRSLNPFLESEIAVESGLMAAEIADMESAVYYFNAAYQLNPYNMTAFAKLEELMYESILLDAYGSQLRRAVILNPYNLNYALKYADFTRLYGMFDASSSAYEYSGRLFKYLNRDVDLPGYIYLPWVQVVSKSKKSMNELPKVLNYIRDDGIFDVELETIAAKSLHEDLGLNAIDELDLLEKDLLKKFDSGDLKAHQLAWFYCFGKVNPAKALEFANKSYAENPDDKFVVSIFAYSLAINGQEDMVADLVKDTYKSNQIAGLSYAMNLFKQDKKMDAISLLKDTVSLNQASIESDTARELLLKNDSEYVFEYDTVGLENAIASNLGSALLPGFKTPDKLIDFKINVTGNEFLYSSPIEATIVLTNKSDDDLLINESSFINGNLRIDAKITGDLDIELPAVIAKTVKPGYALKAGKSAFFDVRLDSGELENVLKRHPQAELMINCKVYLDPVAVGDQIQSAHGDVGKSEFTVRREKVDFSKRYLLQRLDVFENGRVGQKIATAELFAGLLAEMEEMQDGKILYRYKMTPPELLYSAFVRSLTEDSWETKVNVIRYLKNVKLNYELINAISANLNDEKWPVRLAALDVLSQKSDKGFENVVNWLAKTDPDPLVKKYAKAVQRESK